MTNAKFSEMFAEVSLTHHDLVCGMLGTWDVVASISELLWIYQRNLLLLQAILSTFVVSLFVNLFVPNYLVDEVVCFFFFWD